MRVDYTCNDVNRAEVYNDEVTIQLSALINCSLEEADIISWINSCESKEMINNIIKAAQYRKRYLFQDNDDDFRSRA